MFTPVGIVTRSELLVRGWTPAAITAAVRGGSLVRVRRAWYATPGTPYEQRIAVALGGRAGGTTAARSYGMWTGEDRDIHVSWPRHGNIARTGRRLRLPVAQELHGVRIVSHWRRDSHVGDAWRETPLDAIRQVFLTCDRPLAVATADSGCRLGLVTVEEVRRMLESLPSRCRVPPGAIDGLTDSGLESIVRLWLLVVGIAFRLHAEVHGLEVDFLIGRSLIVETDGQGFHTGEAFRVDRERDLLTGSHGYVTIRLSYRQLMDDWTGCVRRISVALERGDHLRVVD